jgi:hypothetical protein
MVKGQRLRVVNRALVRQLAQQYGLVGSTGETELSLGVPGLGAKHKRVARQYESDDPRLLDLVVEELRNSELLKIHRPESYQDFILNADPSYVFEEVVATPVTLPTSSLLDGLAEPRLNVWVLEPGEAGSAHEWEFTGTFVFLVEELDYAEGLPSFMSGVSALRFTVSIATNGTSTSLGELRQDWDESLGRGDVEHPIQKLERLGGIAHRPRPITTVYRIVYMSDEQVYLDGDGQRRRCHDAMAYPLFIAD